MSMIEKFVATGMDRVRINSAGFISLLMIAVSGCVSTHSIEEFDPVLIEIANDLEAQLEGDVVGYAFALGRDELVTGAGGFARMPSDGASSRFTPDTPMIIASVSKWVSALATMRLLQDRGLSLDEPIGAYFPNEWQVEPYFQNLTFAQLLTHKTGIKTHGNGPMSIERIKAFFTQPIDPNSQATCRGFQATQDTSPVSPNDLEYCYSNFNSAVLLVLLPNVASSNQLLPRSDQAGFLERQYEQLVRRTVFEPVGVETAGCSPIDDHYALSYIYPGDAPGKDWGAQYGRCATGGWYVSPKDLAKVLSSVAAKDGRILIESEQYSSLAEIRDKGIGVDRSTPHMIEKGGVLGDDPGVLATSAMIFFPSAAEPFAAVLYTNSTNRDGKIAHPRPYLESAYASASIQR